MATDAMRAIVVGGTNFGESDRIVRLLTAGEGRIDLLARSARASRRRFVGLLEPGTRLDVTRQLGRGSLGLLVSADRIAGPDRARTDLDRIALLTYGCEVCSSLAPRGSAAERLAGLLGVWLDLLEGEAQPGVASRVALESKALTFAGLRPALLGCAACGEVLDDPVVFDPEAGGGVHARCGGGRPVTVDTLRALEILRRTPLLQTPGEAVPSQASGLLADFIQHHIERRLVSRALLDELTSDDRC